MAKKGTEANEIVEVKSEVGKVDLGRDLVIKNDDDLARAVAVFQGIKKLAKAIKARKEAVTKPLNDALKTWRAQFKPFETELEDAEAKVEAKIIDYKAKRDAQAQKKEDRIAQDVADGKISAEKAVDKLDGVQRVAMDGSHTRTTKALEIYDAAALPREFLVPDEPRIREALKAGTEVPGARLVDKVSLV